MDDAGCRDFIYLGQRFGERQLVVER